MRLRKPFLNRDNGFEFASIRLRLHPSSLGTTTSKFTLRLTKLVESEQNIPLLSLLIVLWVQNFILYFDEVERKPNFVA